MVIGSLDGEGLQVSVRPLGHFCESPEPCFQSQGDRIRTSISQREQCCLSRGDAAEFLQSVPGADVLVCSPCLVGRISLLVVSGVFVLHLLMVIISAGVHTDSLGASRRYLGHTGNHCEV